MTTLIHGTPIAARILALTAHSVSSFKDAYGFTPKLGVILVGNDKPSGTYVANKGRAAKKVKLDFELHRLPATAEKHTLIVRIREIQKDAALAGLIVQLPLPRPAFTADVLNAIDPAVDVDCLTNANLGKLMMNTHDIEPPTPGAVFEILDSLGIDVAGKNVTILGAGPLVGKPLAVMMMNKRASVTTCNSATRDSREKCLRADIIVTGVGKHGVLTGDMVSDSAVIIDTGVDFIGKKMVGDVDIESLAGKNVRVTTTPGGVGPITVAKLLYNTALLAKKKGTAAYDKKRG